MNPAVAIELEEVLNRFDATPAERDEAYRGAPQAYMVLEHLGVRSDLLAIVGSIGDTMGEGWAAQQLHRRNSEQL